MFQSSPLIAEGRYCLLLRATENKYLHTLFREKGLCVLGQSIKAPDTPVNHLISFIRETSRIFTVAPGSRYTISGSS